MSSIICRMNGVKDAEVKDMTFFGYVDRQKELIRGRHAGEEIVVVGGRTEAVMQTEAAFRPAEKIMADTACKSTEELLKELGAMKGLNRRERERFYKTASAV